MASARAGAATPTGLSKATLTRKLNTHIMTENSYVEAAAADFARHTKGGGGWALGLAVAACVEKGKGVGGYRRGHGNVDHRGSLHNDRKVSATGFASLAGCATKSVMDRLEAWERAAAAGIVAPASTLVPADWDDATKLPTAGTWGDFYQRHGGGENTPENIGKKLANDPALAEAAAKALADLGVTAPDADDDQGVRWQPIVVANPTPAAVAPVRTISVVPASPSSPHPPQSGARRLPWPAGTCASPRPQDEYPQRISAAVRELDKLVDMVMVTGLPTDPEVRKALDQAVVLIGNGEHNLRAVIHNHEVVQAVAT